MSDRIEEQAAAWLIQLESAGSPEKWAALDAWLAANPRHRAAFLRLSVSWRRVDQLRNWRAFDGTVDENLLSRKALRARKAAERTAKIGPLWSFGWRAAATAATVLLAIYLLAPLASGYFGAEVYTTGVGNRQHIELVDGSTIDLNTNSQLRVHFTAGKREITLMRGEAAFKVAHNPNRPFDVQAGINTFRAVGTAFSVRLRNATHADVHVTEGRVAINPPSTRVLTPGDTAAVTERRVVITREPVDILTRRLLWTQGRLFFSGETLVDAVGEFNRYNRRRLVITDPKIAGLQISGTFTATDPEGFVAALKKPFGIRALPTAGGADSAVIRLEGKDK